MEQFDLSQKEKDFYITARKEAVKDFKNGNPEMYKIITNFLDITEKCWITCVECSQLPVSDEIRQEFILSPEEMLDKTIKPSKKVQSIIVKLAPLITEADDRELLFMKFFTTVQAIMCPD